MNLIPMPLSTSFGLSWLSRKYFVCPSKLFLVKLVQRNVLFLGKYLKPSTFIESRLQASLSCGLFPSHSPNLMYILRYDKRRSKFLRAVCQDIFTSYIPSVLANKKWTALNYNYIYGPTNAFICTIWSSLVNHSEEQSHSPNMLIHAYPNCTIECYFLRSQKSKLLCLVLLFP